MIGKVAITTSYGIIYLFSFEQFPTIMRNARLLKTIEDGNRTKSSWNRWSFKVVEDIKQVIPDCEKVGIKFVKAKSFFW